MSRLSAEVKAEFAQLAQAQLAKACATCLALGMSVAEIERIVTVALAGAAVGRLARRKKVVPDAA